jgi:hypothetical protein
MPLKEESQNLKQEFKSSFNLNKTIDIIDLEKKKDS